MLYWENDLHPVPTMVTTMEVDVEELWTSTVASTPIMSPTTGFLSRSLSLKTLPACLPPSSLKEVLRRSKEHTNSHSSPSRQHPFSRPIKTFLAFAEGESSGKDTHLIRIFIFLNKWTIMNKNTNK